MSDALPLAYLARHGETAWTISRQHTGRTDLPLTAQGEAEARRLGARLDGLKFAAVFTSPLQRARRTCELAGFGYAAIVEPDILEWNYGAYEGRTSAEIHAERPDWDLFRDGCPGGESPDQIGTRADRAIRRVREITGDTLLFSSSHFLRVFAARWLGLDRRQYGCGPVQLTGSADGLYERHLLFDNVADPATVGARERYEAFARSVRDVLSQRWVRTDETYERQNPKRVYYLSMEFLIGRSLTNNITNMLLGPFVADFVKQASVDWVGLLEEEPDAGLGNGGTRTTGRVLPRLDGHNAAARDGVRAPLRVRGSPLPRRRRSARSNELDRGGPGQARAHGQRRHRGLAQHERRGGDPLGAATLDHGEGSRRDVSRALQQQDQRRHPRRWMLLANPALAGLITEAIGDGWTTDLGQLSRLKPLAGDQGFRDAVRAAKRAAKVAFAQWLKSASGQTVDPDTIFDSQVKRIHEYKRQLLNALRIVVLYNRLRENPALAMTPRTFLFAGKAAPAYHVAKLIIKFLNNLAETIDADPVTRGRLKVLFLPEYNVSLAERLIPATDVSNQISTAGYEASGTSSMKFIMNGALTIGTRDGATIEMAQEAGEENFFLFGLTAEQVAGSRGRYNPRWHYDNQPEVRAALDLIFSDHFSRYEPGIFAPLRDTLLTHGDHYMHLADLVSYLEADAKLCALYADPDAWARKAILNVASSGKFSSDRTIAQYAADIWHVKPCPVS